MSLQPLTAVNCASLLQPGFSLLQLDGDTLLFGQKGWPKRSCPTGIFGVRIKDSELKLRPISFSSNSCYLPPLRCPAVARLEPRDGDPEGYLIHGGRTPNNELSAALYVLSVENRGCNRKLTLCCQEKELAGETPSARYGHTASVVHSRGKRACVLFGGRAYQPPGQRTTETWNSVVDCAPKVFLVDLDYGCSSAHYLPEFDDGQSFHLALSRGDSVYLLGGYSLSSDSRPPRLFRLRVELLLGSPKLTCEVLDNGLSITSAIATRLGTGHEYVVLGGYQADQQKQLKCCSVVLDDAGIHIEPREAPAWSGEICSSRLWFGGNLGKGHALIAIPAEGNPAPADPFYLYQVSFEQEGGGGSEEVLQGCSQESTDMEDSTPLEDSEELYFGREPHELDMMDSEGDTYNEEDEEDESQTGYWIRCCAGCQVDPNTWEPFYSTELTRPAMIYCSLGTEGGHWVHAQCMKLPEPVLLRLSQNNCKYFCLDHANQGRQERTPPRQERTPPHHELPLKRLPMKPLHRKAPVKLNMNPTKKSFLRRLFD